MIPTHQKTSTSSFLLLNSLFILFSAYTYMYCVDTKDWLVENALVLGFICYLFLQRSNGKFHFSTAAYLSIYTFLALHQWGAQYAYVDHPLGEWMRYNLQLNRNGYDRLVHTMFGAFMYQPLKELCHYQLRMPLPKASKQALQYIFMCACIFELIEFAVANYILPDANGQTYVGTQGDAWDAHKDIMLAVIGSISIAGLQFLVRQILASTRNKVLSH
jgi:putative membrane protein